MSFKKRVLKNLANFTEKQLCWSLFLIKLQALKIKKKNKKLQHRCFPVKFAKFLQDTFFYRTPPVAASKG